MKTSNLRERFMGRTSLITAAAIAGVALAGAAAVTANVGILNAAGSSDIGNLSATGELVSSEPQVIDVYLDPATGTATTSLDGSVVAGAAAANPAAAAPAPAPASAPAPAQQAGALPTASPAAGSPSAAPPASSAAASSQPSAESQTFAVDGAGTVTVAKSSEGLRLGAATANPGWTWRLARSSGSALTVAFTAGSRTLEFTATLGPDGSISGAVTDVSRPPTQPTTTAPVSPPVRVDDHDDEEDDHYESPEHEGGEDDD